MLSNELFFGNIQIIINRANQDRLKKIREGWWILEREGDKKLVKLSRNLFLTPLFWWRTGRETAEFTEDFNFCCCQGGKLTRPWPVVLIVSCNTPWLSRVCRNCSSVFAHCLLIFVQVLVSICLYNRVKFSITGRNENYLLLFNAMTFVFYFR